MTLADTIDALRAENARLRATVRARCATYELLGDRTVLRYRCRYCGCPGSHVELIASPTLHAETCIVRAGMHL